MSRALIAAASLVASVMLVLQGATFSYVVSVESRLTRLETIVERELPLKGRSIGPGAQALDDGGEQRLEIVAPVEGVAHGEAERLDRLRALRALDGEPAAALVVTNPPGGVQDRSGELVGVREGVHAGVDTLRGVLSRAVLWCGQTKGGERRVAPRGSWQAGGPLATPVSSAMCIMLN